MNEDQYKYNADGDRVYFNMAGSEISHLKRKIAILELANDTLTRENTDLKDFIAGYITGEDA